MTKVVLEGLGEGIEEVIVQAWFIEEGEPVSLGDDIVELTSDKGNVIVQAPVSGILSELYYDEGETVKKGEVLCQIADKDDDDPDAGNDEDDE